MTGLADLLPPERPRAAWWERVLYAVHLRKRPAPAPVGGINRDPVPGWHNDPEPRSSTGRTSDFDSDNARSSRAGAATKEAT